MSVGKHALKYTVAAIAVAAIIIVSTTLYLNQPRTGQLGGSRLAIRLTDPPLVPSGTTSLNLTYSSIALLVGEPASGGLTTKTITVTPSGGSATLDLLKLQNVSQTIGLTSLVNGTVVYSITFTVTGISIDVNGAKSPVTLASGSVLTVTLAHPSPLEGANIALLRLNPVIVNTPTGYQMIPSAVGIIRAAGPGEQNEEQVGSKQVLTNEDEDQLDHARGSLNATLMELSVSGNSTTISVEVKNTGNSSVVLNAIGIHGNFTALGHSCRSNSQTETHTTEKHSNTSTTESTSTSTSTTSNSTESECEFEHADEVVFVPVNATVSGTSCVTLKMELVNGDHENVDHGLTLTKGQCVKLTFSGAMSFGEAKFVLVPSTGSGQVYGVHVIASQGSNLELSCKLPLTAQSCSVQNKND
jgi:hypothetical protein